MDAVGAAHFAQGGPTAFHDVGDAEAAADLDELTPGDDDFAAGAEGVHADEHGGGVVVDYEGGLRAGEFAEQLLHMAVAASAFAGGEVQFEVGVAPAGLEDGVHGFVREDGPAHIRMDDHAGRVEHASEAGGAFPFREGGELRQEGVHLKLFGIGQALLPDVVAAGVQKAVGEFPEQRARYGREQRRGGVLQRAQAGVHRGKGSKKIGHRLVLFWGEGQGKGLSGEEGEYPCEASPLPRTPIPLSPDF